MHLNTHLFLLGVIWPVLVTPYEGYTSRGQENDIDPLSYTGTARDLAAQGKKGVLYINRIGPSSSTLYLANADGTNERPLFANPEKTPFGRSKDYFATFSADGQWITFTTERNGDGNSDIYRVRADGTGTPEPLIASRSCELAGVLSPDNSKLAYVSSANGFKSNIWIKDLVTGKEHNLTNVEGVKGNPWEPDAYMRPAWSPDGKWIAFSSDRLTPWFGHREMWEFAPSMSIYVIGADGSGFRQVATAGLQKTLGSPKWSKDGKRIVYYEADKDEAADAEWYNRLEHISSQIVSVDVATGRYTEVHTEGPYLKLFPQYISDRGDIGFLVKGGPQEGVNYTLSSPKNLAKAAQFQRHYLRSPSWSPDGKTVVYEVPTFYERKVQDPIVGLDDEWEYRFIDVMPSLSKQGKIAYIEFFTGNSTVAIMNSDGTDKQIVFDPVKSGLYIDHTWVLQKVEGTMQPTWSPDGQWVAFSLGLQFNSRTRPVGHGQQPRVYRVKVDGSHLEALTDGTVNSGMPSWSPDGKNIVFREWGGPWGLKIIHLETKVVRPLTTTEYTTTGGTTDNMPAWSPDGSRIVFTRRTNETDFDVCTIRPDGSDLQILTSETGAVDGHAVWTYDGKIAFSSGRYGYLDEVAIYDETFQPYGVIMVMDADGSNKKVVTNSLFEDATPLFVPNEMLTPRESKESIRMEL